jgi:hypothetical protein
MPRWRLVNSYIIYNRHETADLTFLYLFSIYEESTSNHVLITYIFCRQIRMSSAVIVGDIMNLV